jgi:hypothetical protein
MLARQWIIGAGIEPGEVFTRKTHVADNKAGATEADGGRFFKGKADGLGGSTKAAGALGRCSGTVAAEIKLGTSVVV